MYATWDPNWEKKRGRVRTGTVLEELKNFFTCLEYITHKETPTLLSITFRDLNPRDTFEYDEEDWDHRLDKIYGDYRIKCSYPGRWEDHLILMEIEMENGDMVKKSIGEESSSDDSSD